ncbi:MAG: tRNA (adenosine(37)-N6)-threonylcarbamoyltransferase complex ATPase subunit type 1 TsaE [Planctomycetes bacterium]|nr:tRNA (adenosine(37)-N6)-threonylcarbamoyltransferase complex ATPase subunit type 1 TsaE [Planctomycetota bacterium]
MRSSGHASTWTAETHSPEETLDLGRRIGRAARPGDVLALVGDLGSGKTVLAKGAAEGLGAASAREVTSPTFVLCREHLGGRMPFYHLDAYRLRGAADLEAIGAAEILGGDGLSALEWADRAPQALPPDHLEVRLEIIGPSDRRLTFTPRGRGAARLLAGLTPVAPGGC